MSQIETNLLTAQEVADILKVKKSTVYEMIKRGDLPSRKIGKQLRISREDMERLLGAATQEPPPFSTPARRSAPAARAGNRLVLCGQDILLDFLTAHLNGTPHAPNLLRARAGSYHGLYQLYLGAVDFATCHLWDEETGTYNIPFIRRMLPGIPVVAVRLLGRPVGLYVKAGNPKSITGWEDFRRADITLVNRERGSGARVLLDGKLNALGIPGRFVSGYAAEQSSALSVASAVAKGMGDVGVGAKHASYQISGVDFLPMQQEWYDLVFLADQAQTPAMGAVVEYIASPGFRQEVMQTKDYDASQTGRILLGEAYL